MPRCGKCDRSIEKIENFRNHECTDRKLVAVFVSPNRKTTDAMAKSAFSLGSNCRFLVRGIECEEVFSRVAKRNEAEVLIATADDPKDRDEAMIEKADLILVFPATKNGKTNSYAKITEFKGRKIKTIVYPDS